ncbi:MAG: inositol monophosphatase [Candidatus Micrarchaeota archaeon]|nr:inositol monophosphatase [Candidatus Micrarchaeota archaeon]
MIYKEQFVLIAKEAGINLREMFRNGEDTAAVKKKEGMSPAIAADIKTERFILDAIRKTGFSGTVLSEEAGLVRFGNGTMVIHLDPVDGSRNYMHGIPHYCISIGVTEEGKLVLGVVYNPNTDELFVADGETSFTINGKRAPIYPNKEVLIVSATDKEELHKLTSNAANRDIKVRFGGSAALDLCYVAARRFDAAVITKISPHDIAAGLLIAKRSGAIIRDIDSREEATINSRNLIAASSEKLLQRIIEIIR